ncbi:MAG: hypothetical protein ACRDR6_10885 [Pseudonocardiaceae bacterium]
MAIHFEHWHFSTYRVINDPPEATVRFSPPLPSLGAAKVAIKRHITTEVLPDPDCMVLVGVTEAELMQVLGQWMSLPGERFLHYWPWAHECYPCMGSCEELAYQNAVEMAAWMTENRIVPVVVVGTASAFLLGAAPSDWGERIIATRPNPPNR